MFLKKEESYLFFLLQDGFQTYSPDAPVVLSAATESCGEEEGIRQDWTFLWFEPCPTDQRKTRDVGGGPRLVSRNIFSPNLDLVEKPKK